MQLEEIGTKLNNKDSEDILSVINKVLNNRDKNKFPGYQPVSFLKSHINELINQDYLVCEKSDGIRALLLSFFDINLQKMRSFFLNRKLEFFELNFVFPKFKLILLDGELLSNAEYLICDCLICENNVTQLNLINRLTKAAKFTSEYEKLNNEFLISVKKMTKSYGILEVLKNTTHKTDGVIFTPINHPYKSGTEQLLLKWKPPHLNTVDFLIRKTSDSNIYKLYSINLNSELIFFDFYYSETSEELDEKLGEFSFNVDKIIYDLSDLAELKGGWSLLKIRTDKNTPNPVSVVFNLLKSIDEDVNLEYFKDNLKNIYEGWKLRNN